MSRRRISAALCEQVVQRADHCCEYCLYPQTQALLAFEVEHIIAEKHGGETTLDNLALACPMCNRYKGADIGSLDPLTGALVAFFNPRSQAWSDHFDLAGAEIIPLTPEARVPPRILRLNAPDRLVERQALLEAGVYPPGPHAE